MKTEAVSYSIDDLAREGKSRWDGVRNYQARNFMKGMQVGDRVLIYHSNGKSPAIVGTATVSSTAIPDSTQFDQTSQYFDKKASVESPIWWAVEVKFEQKFSTELTLKALHNCPELVGMELLKRGSRLSIQPVRPSEFETILHMASQTKKP
jgi:predicted RNA-binding protein with PUA-like domain